MSFFGFQGPVRRKVFVSYHHGGDQAYYDAFSSTFHDQYDAITDNSLEREIDSSSPEGGLFLVTTLACGIRALEGFNASAPAAKVADHLLRCHGNLPVMRRARNHGRASSISPAAVVYLGERRRRRMFQRDPHSAATAAVREQINRAHQHCGLGRIASWEHRSRERLR